MRSSNLGGPELEERRGSRVAKFSKRRAVDVEALNQLSSPTSASDGYRESSLWVASDLDALPRSTVAEMASA